MLEAEKTWVTPTQNKPSKGENFVLKGLSSVDIADTFIIEKKSGTWARKVFWIKENIFRFAKKEFSQGIESNKIARRLILLATSATLAYIGILCATSVCNPYYVFDSGGNIFPAVFHLI